MPSHRSRRLASALTLALAGLAATVAGCKKSEPSPAAASAPAAPGAPAGPPAAAAAGSGTLGKGSIHGSVKMTGKPPEARGVTTPDPFCARQKIVEEEVLVNPAGGLKNVLVHVVKGAGVYDPPKNDAIVDQNGCMYRPRVQAVMAGQNVLIRNSDQTLHNVHTYRGASTMFNQAQIPGMGPMSKTFAESGQVIKFRCDVHPWMTGYVAVVNNPFFAVTGDDGSFTIEHLPPGTYTLEAWHERLGTKMVADLKVGEDQPATADFAFP